MLSTNTKLIFFILIFREKGYYSSREELTRIVESRFHETVACIGNPDLNSLPSAVEVEQALVSCGPLSILVTC